MVQHRRTGVVRVAAWYRTRVRPQIGGELGEGSRIECVARAHSLERLSRGGSGRLGKVRAFARTLIKGYSERTCPLGRFV